jgi:23S rRNA pseudouridine2605 synthase
MAQPFKKFMGQKDSGAKKKERIRQEKKKVRQETKEFFEKKKQEAREARAQGQATGYKPDRGRKEQAARNTDNEAPMNRGYRGNEKGGRNAGKSSGFKSSRPGGGKAESYKPKAKSNTWKAQKSGTQPQTTNYKPQTVSGFKPQSSSNDERGPGGKEQRFEKKPALGIKPKAPGNEATRPRSNEKMEGNRKPALNIKPKTESKGKETTKPAFAKASADNAGKAPKAGTQPETTNQKPETAVPGSMPLNKFIAHAGICSRRDAVEIVKSGKVIVNGSRILEPGHKVTDKDEIKVNGKVLFARRNLVYILLNKPKDFITTTEDPQGRKTVMDIVRSATPERVYPIGRLDRNTTGVLLLTNDGELAQKLSHPSYEIRKIYEVKLDKVLVKKDFDSLVNGITLEDGFIAPDLLAYADPKDKSIIGIEIHSGRNRIVRRIFEQLGYDVRNLDRVMYANLTKKNVDRGKWRFLTEKEVRLLKYLNSSYTKNKITK